MHRYPSYSDILPRPNVPYAQKITFSGLVSSTGGYAPPTPDSQLPIKILTARDSCAPLKAAARVDARGFVSAVDIPTWSGTEGVRFDFNDGCRVLLPDGQWTVRLRDTYSDTTLFDAQVGAGIVTSTSKHFVPFSIEIDSGAKRVFKHRFDAHNKPVLIQFETNRLGEALGWFDYAVKFQRQHHCTLTCSMSASLISLLKPGYDNIELVTPDLVKPECYYASYRLGRFGGDEARTYQPSAPQLVGQHRSAAYMLGVDPREAPPRIELVDNSRPLSSRYVCIAAQSALRCARWDRPGGWRELQRALTTAGYQIVCIDSPSPDVVDESSVLAGASYCPPPDTPWTERARWLRHAECLISVPGDFPWLAWAVGTPVVLISGFTHPVSEFDTPYRVINFHACNSCWNDGSANFDDADASSCPRHAGTLRQFECTRLVSVEQVKLSIRSIPGIAC
ncbi:autotransporter strand-loop-strand O-heptosyltransferase [Burkholderia ubonensis]|uniref:autotransporter strand-loop-strand O-heptosyltransferase n=1 Tax=Burkholderia ubonensis TaxID=101571 RepID=UPI000757F416|nr:autotransporter strand-loop-strand O-heptosyltransferase [Burkholderia ubonensis]KVP76848.1 autotransporter strand-loop-strand O-heptosyltransferase [Burkholderia ubonensis]